jgi:hypothetical protein
MLTILAFWKCGRVAVRSKRATRRERPGLVSDDGGELPNLEAPAARSICAGGRADLTRAVFQRNARRSSGLEGYNLVEIFYTATCCRCTVHSSLHCHGFGLSRQNNLPAALLRCRFVFACALILDQLSVVYYCVIAATSRSRVIGKSLTRTPRARATAFAIAAPAGPIATSPTPLGASGKLETTSTNTSGTSSNRKIG